MCGGSNIFLLLSISAVKSPFLHLSFLSHTSLDAQCIAEQKSHENAEDGD